MYDSQRSIEYTFFAFLYHYHSLIQVDIQKQWGIQVVILLGLQFSPGFLYSLHTLASTHTPNPKKVFGDFFRACGQVRG